MSPYANGGGNDCRDGHLVNRGEKRRRAPQGHQVIILLMLRYLEKVDDVFVDDYKRLVDKVDDSVADGDVGFDHLGHDHASRMVEIAQQGVGLHVDWAPTSDQSRKPSRRAHGKRRERKNQKKIKERGKFELGRQKRSGQ